MMKKLRAMLGAVVVGLFASHVSAAIIVQDLGTVAPPATLGGYTMTPFGPDGLPNFTNISSLASPLGGTVGFSPQVNTRSIGSGWGTWSHGYTGDVYYSNGASSLTMTLPVDTGAFYLYAEPNNFGLFSVTVTANDGTSLTNSVNGNSGARGFGFYGTAGSEILSLTITTSTTAGGFAVGEFGIAASVPEPGTLALLGLGLAGLAASRRRKH